MTLDVRNADGALDAPRDGARGGYRPADDDGDIVLVDTSGRQINLLPTRMTAAEALDNSLGPRR